MRKFLLALAAILLICAYIGIQFFKQPPSSATKIVEIPSNASVRRIASLLEDQGIIQSKWALIALTKASGNARKLQAGEFSFNIPSSPENTLQTLLHGLPVLHPVLIAEGLTIQDIAIKFQEAQITTAEKFIQASHDPALLQKFQIPSHSFEGYLFPNTYQFPKNEKIETIFKVMLTELKKNISEEDRVKSLSYGWNEFQWLTFASIVEKETGDPEEYALVSSVFHNRLIKDMKLQSDPTVIYGIPNYDGNIHKKDLLTDTPYNTYTRKGLPIAPISNPGAAAIHYAVNPATTKYLYFVANPETGEHVFTEDYKDHVNAVRKYQLKITDPIIPITQTKK